MAEIPLVSVNIEMSKHLELVTAFLARMNPEVLCVQEVMEHDIPLIARASGCAEWRFLPMTHRTDEDPLMNGTMGVGIFSRLPIATSSMSYYRGDSATVPEFDGTDVESKSRTINHGVLICDIEKEGATFRIATMHFTWTPHGAPDEHQREDIKKLLAILAASGELVFTGDLNAPRSDEIFAQLAAAYRDNIPPQHITSIDLDLHRVGRQQAHELAYRMVDGLFTTPAYAASDVELHLGVSDHCAITATISR